MTCKTMTIIHAKPEREGILAKFGVGFNVYSGDKCRPLNPRIGPRVRTPSFAYVFWEGDRRRNC